MVEIKLEINKNVDENAALYFDKAKKAKKKLKGLITALQKSQEKLQKLEKIEEKNNSINTDADSSAINLSGENKQKKSKWYHKFRWFYTSDGNLVVGGRDATTNEIIIKKYTNENDLIFHTEIAGSPFFILKLEKDNTVKTVNQNNDNNTAENKKSHSNINNTEKVSELTLQEVADATISFSRAWKLGLYASDVFYVKPEQLSKEANTGEYVKKGSFIIRGKTNYLTGNINLAVGKQDGVITCAPVTAIKKYSANYVVIEPCNEKVKASDVAKKIQKHLKVSSVDDILKVLPPGSVKIKYFK